MIYLYFCKLLFKCFYINININININIVIQQEYNNNTTRILSILSKDNTIK